MPVATNLTIKNILTEAVKAGAADVHFSSGNVPVFRLSDQLTAMENQEMVTPDFMAELADLVLNPEQKIILAQNKEIILTFDFGSGLRFKINLFHQRGLLSATMRYIPSTVPTAKSLNLPSNIAGLSGLDKGLVLVAGSFGSGRSTTIAALLEEINRTRKEYILTIEDPIEYLFTNQKSIVEQREVGRDTRSFVDALKYFQEEDGDILFLEDMDNVAVIHPVLEIANGGALVFSTLNADSTVKAISKIMDSFQSFDQERIRDLLASSLKAVIYQRLIPKIGGGMVAVFEILLVNDPVRSIISKGNLLQLENIIQTSRHEGMIAFDQALAEMVASGAISRAKAVESAANRKGLENLLK